MKSFNNIILIVLFLGFITFFGLNIYVTPDKAKSEVEKRSLAQQPDVELESIIKGDYTKQYESYITDQFFLRDMWVKGYLNWQLLTNQTFIYDYYINNNWVYPKPFTKVNKEAVHFASENVSELNSFTKKNNIELYFFSLPDRRYMIDIDYPRSVEKSVGQSDKKLFLSLLPREHINVVDVGEKWEEKLNQEDYRSFYYRTDHHWNMFGAFSAYGVIHHTLDEKSSYFNDPSFDKESYRKNCLTNKKFLGVYNTQLYGMIDSSKEKMCYFNSTDANKDNWITYVNGMGEENRKPFSSVYGRAKKMEETSVTYADVYSKDYSEIHVINPKESSSKSKILILKDSYANPMLPLIAENFYQTTFYDVRYNQDENLYDYIKQHDYDVVAFLYSNGRTLEKLYRFGESPVSSGS